MCGLHRYIGGSVGSNLPVEIQLHAQSWRSAHEACPRAPAGTDQEASHEQVWSVTLALVTIRACLIDLMTGLSWHVKDLTSPHPHVVQHHPQVGGSDGLRTQSEGPILAVGGGL